MGVDIATWAQSRLGFYVDRHWQDGRWVLEPGPIRLASYHADLLRHVFAPGDGGRLAYDTVLWCEPAKSGKTALAGLCAQYMALHGERNSSVIMASNRQDQAASLMFKSLTDSLQYNPFLGVTPNRYEVTFHTGNVVKAIPSSSRGAAGERYSLAVFDELWGYVYQDAQRLFDEHKTDPTRQNSMRLCVGYAGYMHESDLWYNLLQTGIAGDPVPELAHIVNADGSPTCYANGRTFCFWSHTPRQPWQTEQWIEGQRRTLREGEFRRMIQTQFVESSGGFFPYENWAKLVDPEHEPLPPGTDTPVYVGLDIATKPGGDDCACIACYQDADRVKVAWHRVWRGGQNRTQPLKLSETVQPFLIEQARQYYIAGLYFDPFQALQLAENLTRAGLYCVEVAQTHGTRGPKDTALFELASNGALVLYDHPDLRAMASAASAKELGNGQLFIHKAGRGKIDLLVALSNCANEARDAYAGPFMSILYDDAELNDWR